MTLHRVTEAALAGAVPILWAAGAVAAATLPRAITARGLRRRALATLLLLGTAIAWTLARTPYAPLSLLLLAGALVVAGVSIPRLMRLRRSARGLARAGSGTPVSPGLRAAAAHPAVRVPLLGTWCVAVASLVVWFAPGAASALLLPVFLATGASWGWGAVSHDRLRRDAVALAA